MMPKKLLNMEIKEVSAVDKGANGRKFLIIKREGAETVSKEKVSFADLVAKVEDEELRKGLTGIYEEMQKEEPKVEPEVEPKEPVVKTEEIPEEIRKQYEALEKRVEVAENIAKQEREARLDMEYVKEAEKYSHVGETEVLTKLFKGASEEYREDLKKVFEGLEEKLSKSDLFKELGGNGEEAGGALAEIDKKVVEIRKAEPGVSYEQAFSKVLETDQELYVAYLEEK